MIFRKHLVHGTWLILRYWMQHMQAFAWSSASCRQPYSFFSFLFLFFGASTYQDIFHWEFICRGGEEGDGCSGPFDQGYDIVDASKEVFWNENRLGRVINSQWQRNSVGLLGSGQRHKENNLTLIGDLKSIRAFLTFQSLTSHSYALASRYTADQLASRLFLFLQETSVPKHTLLSDSLISVP